MPKTFLRSLFALLLATTTANATTLFYGGDFDPTNPNANALTNENDASVSGSPYGSAAYQNFVVSGASWNVTGLFSNNLSDLDPSTAYWEIRTGISEGNGGTLVASGTDPVTQTPTGRDESFAEFMDLVNVSLVLGPGTYWMTVVPLDPGSSGRSFNSNTFGLNSIGTQITNQQFWNSSFFGVNFTNANAEGVFPTFSDGVIGTTGAVPEPSSMFLLGPGLVVAAGFSRRRLV